MRFKQKAIERTTYRILKLISNVLLFFVITIILYAVVLFITAALPGSSILVLGYAIGTFIGGLILWSIQSSVLSICNDMVEQIPDEVE